MVPVTSNVLLVTDRMERISTTGAQRGASQRQLCQSRQGNFDSLEENVDVVGDLIGTRESSGTSPSELSGYGCDQPDV